MPHQRLLHKLKAHGIGEGIIDWIEQWLTDRRQRVGDTVLGTTCCKRKGVTISADMKVLEQCGIAAPKGNEIYGLIRINNIQGQHK